MKLSLEITILLNCSRKRQT